jgi:uncharacterized protein (TIGR02271 family)
MFDDRSEAERAKSELQQIGATAEIVDQSRMSGGTSSSSSSSSGGQGYNQTYGNSGATGAAYDQSGGGSGRGFWAELKDAFVSDEDRSSYEEGVRRGGVLLTAHVDESRADEAIRILDREGTVDMDQREQSWRSEGWQGYQGSSQRSALGQSSMTGSNQTERSAGTHQEEHIPIIEEQLRVGKREVSRGGARVRSYVEETPVDEDVTLREEHVHIERRPVDRALTGESLTGDAFQERTVEMTETAEEAVVAKEARIKEELVVSKDVEQRQEHIHDTVRHTEVDVDEGLDRDSLRSDRGSGDWGALFNKDR